MYFSGLMFSKLIYHYGGPGSFPGRGGYEFTCQFFEGCNEDLMGKETEGRGSTVK